MRTALLSLGLLVFAHPLAARVGKNPAAEQKFDYTAFTPFAITRYEREVSNLEEQRARLRDDVQRLQRSVSELERMLSEAGYREDRQTRTALELRQILMDARAPSNQTALVQLLLPPGLRVNLPAGEESSKIGIKDEPGQYDVYSSFIAAESNETRLYQPMVLTIAFEKATTPPAATLDFGDVKLNYATTIVAFDDTSPILHPNGNFLVEVLEREVEDSKVPNPKRQNPKRQFSWRLTPRPGRYDGDGPWNQKIQLSVAGSLSTPLVYAVRITNGATWRRWLDRTVLFFGGHAYATLVGILSAAFTLVVNLDKIGQILAKARRTEARDAEPALSEPLREASE